MNEHDLSLGLRAIHRERAGTADIHTIREHILGAPIQRMPQRRPWLPQLGRWSLGSVFSAAKFGVAGVLVALFSGFLLAGVLTQPSDEPAPAAGASATATSTAPTATPMALANDRLPWFEIPDDLPAGMLSGTIETPAGLARWVYHQEPCCPTSSTPSYGTLVPWGNGVAVQPWWTNQLYLTSDGVDWQLTTLPAPDHDSGFTLEYVDDRYVLIAHDGRIWSSTDALVWDELETSAIEEARPDGWEQRGIEVEVGPLLVDDRIVVGIRFRYTLPRRQLGIPTAYATSGMWKTPGYPLRYGLGDHGDLPGEAEGEWELRFKETERGLKVVDVKTGESLGLLEGARASELYENEEGETRAYFAIDGDRIERIERPDLRAEDYSGFVTTPDGARVPRAYRRPGQEAPGGLSGAAKPRRLGSGWFAFARDGLDGSVFSDHVWAHVGGEWVGLDSMFADTGYAPADSQAFGVGNVTLFWGAPMGSPVTLWILTLPDQM